MIELEQARGLLARAVLTKGARGPGFIYSRSAEGINLQCYYNPYSGDYIKGDPRKTTGCLIGVALSLAGYTVESEEEDNGNEYIGSVKELSYRYPNWMTHDVINYFREAQDSQDSGHTWGTAYAAAENSLK